MVNEGLLTWDSVLTVSMSSVGIAETLEMQWMLPSGLEGTVVFNVCSSEVLVEVLVTTSCSAVVGCTCAEL